MRILFFLAASLIQACIWAQDTLYFSSGFKEIVSILDVDSSAQKLAFVDQDNNRRVVIFSALNRVGFDDEPPIQPDYFESIIGLITTEADVASQYENQPGFFRIPSRYTYGNLMLYTNIIAPFFKGTYHFPHNPSLSLGAEWLLTDKVGISGFSRIGYSFKPDPPAGLINTNAVNVYPYLGQDSWELIYQIGFSPKIYLYGQTKFSLFLAPYTGFGKYYYLHTEYYEIYGISTETGMRDIYERTDLSIERKIKRFTEFGLGGGILLNLSRRINIATQFLVFTSNTDTYSTVYYTNYQRQQVTKIYEDYWNPREGLARLQFFLVYRFDGKVRAE